MSGEFIGDTTWFYLVWCQDTLTVTKPHGTYSRAQREADRLSKAHPGKNFYVMKALMRFNEPITLDMNLSYAELQNLPPEMLAQLSRQARELHAAGPQCSAGENP